MPTETYYDRRLREKAEAREAEERKQAREARRRAELLRRYGLRVPPIRRTGVVGSISALPSASSSGGGGNGPHSESNALAEAISAAITTRQRDRMSALMSNGIVGPMQEFHAFFEQFLIDRGEY